CARDLFGSGLDYW
nr:immunoglobulin heavy chain junction region [Macaca mulatta]